MYLRTLTDADPPILAAAFALLGWNKPASQYEGYLAEQARGEREVLVAWSPDGEFVGYGTLVWRSGYPPFAEAGIPEIVDLNVLPPWRRRGIASALLEALEERAFGRSPEVGIGVGLDPDYGPAQRLYARRGYLPDARGITCDDGPVRWGQWVRVDDGLVLHLTRRRTEQESAGSR